MTDDACAFYAGRDCREACAGVRRSSRVWKGETIMKLGKVLALIAVGAIFAGGIVILTFLHAFMGVGG